jgi:hypothetical protein
LPLVKTLKDSLSLTLQINNTSSNLRTPTRKLHHRRSAERVIEWRLWNGGQSEEILDAVFEAGEIADGCDAARSVGVEEAVGNAAGAVGADGEVV